MLLVRANEQNQSSIYTKKELGLLFAVAVGGPIMGSCFILRYEKESIGKILTRRGYKSIRIKTCLRQKVEVLMQINIYCIIGV